MKVKATIRKSSDKKEPPKRTPIVVSNPNNPRLKAYNDSLRLYNKFKNDKTNYLNFINSQGFNPAYVEQWNTNGYVDTDVHPKIGAVAYGMLQNSGGGFNKDAKGVPIDFTTYPTKTGIDRKVLDDSELNKTIRKRYSIYKKPVQPVIFKAKEKEKIEKIEPTAKKIFQKEETPKIKKTPTAVKPSELIYRVEYFDPESGKKAAKFFPNEKQGSEFQKSLSSEQNKYGSRGMYVKNENK
jgi:hypothetical protein